MTIKKVTVISGALLALSAVALIFSLIVVYKSDMAINESRSTISKSLILANELRESSRSLTTAVRKFAATGDERFAKEYDDIVRVREGKIPRPQVSQIAPGQTISLNELMKQAHFSDRELQLLQLAANLSNRLISLEMESMTAMRGMFPDDRGQYTVVGKPDKEKALNLVFSDAYNSEVDKIMAPFDIFKQELDARLDRTMSSASEHYDNSMHMVWIITALGLAACGVHLLMVNLMIVRPILLCDTFAREVASGRSDTTLTYKSSNEIGSLAFSLRSMLSSLMERITIKEQAEQAMREAAQAAKEASRMKSTFLANMSHEIRTPMNGIVGFSELAMDDEESTPRTRDYLRKIKASSEGLLGIINDILDISKIESGKMVLEKTPFNMHDVFELCETISAPKALEKGVALHFYSEPLADKMLLGDSTKLRQALLNLISNAIKFTSNGIVKVKAIVEEPGERDVRLYFEVRDSGIGMTADQIKKAFEPFTQADSSITRQYGGTGLGLSITKSIIEIMGGTLKVDSMPGVGSRFSFSLTLETMAELDTALPAEKEYDTGDKKPLFSGNVLVCEDNLINQEVVAEHLARVGLTATVAANGKIGVDLVRSRQDRGQHFDLIFMDIHMPVMDGLEATELLTELGNQTPIVALTANVMAQDKAKYRHYGMVECIGKPFKSRELWACLSRYLPQIGEEECEADSERLSGMVASGRSKQVIDRALGLERAAGSLALYERLLVDFAKNSKNICREIGSASRDGDFKLAHRLAHSLKSVSATIGAEKLSASAAVIEDSLATGRDDVRELLQALQTELDAVMNEIKVDEEETPSPRSSTELDIEKAQQLLEKLSSLLESGNSDSLDMLDEIREKLSPLGEISETLVAQIEDYDFEPAVDTMKSIEAMLRQKAAN